ncbi:MAG: DUF4386 family protein [Pseudomonadota bacterium]
MLRNEIEVLNNHKRFAAYAIVLFVCGSLVAYLGLVQAFDFPDILRRSPQEILVKFHANETWVRAFYYIFAVSHLVLAAAVLVSARALKVAEGPWLTIAVAGGVAYALTQTIGFLRWPFLVPQFADMATNAESTASLEAALPILEAFHRYAGIAIGENLSFWAMSAWLVGMGVTLRNPIIGHRKIGGLWIATGCAVMVYTFEQFGGAFSVLSPLLLTTHGIAYGLLILFAWSTLESTDGEAIGRIHPMPLVLVSLFSITIIAPGII